CRPRNHANALSGPGLEPTRRTADALLQPAHRADAVLDLLESVVRCGIGQRETSPEVQLVGAVHPMGSASLQSPGPSRFGVSNGGPALLCRRLATEVVLAELGQPDGNNGTRQHSGPEVPEIVQRPLQYPPIVDPG